MQHRVSDERGAASKIKEAVGRKVPEVLELKVNVRTCSFQPSPHIQLFPTLDDGGLYQVWLTLFSRLPSLSLIPTDVQAQVVLLKNLDPAAQLVNGSRGVVEGFESVPIGALPERMHKFFPGLSPVT